MTVTDAASPLAQRHDFVFFFDVTDGNPNGDPDAGDMPRTDPETGQGLVTDVALKRKVRNFVELARPDAPGFEIYVSQGAVLNQQHERAYVATGLSALTAEERRRGPKDPQASRELTRWMCANFFDIRTFGAVMSTGVNAGQVRGPVQLAFARSIDPILPLEIAITRMAATTTADGLAKGARTIGRKYIVPYGLYRVHGHVNAALAGSDRGSGFSEADLKLFYEALWRMFEFDASAQRGDMAARKLVVFRHASPLGCAPSHRLFERVTATRKSATGAGPPSPPRRFGDYEITLDRLDLPRGVAILEDETTFR